MEKTQKRYWWVNFFIQVWDSQSNYYEDRVQDVHPFYCKKRYEIIDDKSRKIYSLHSWKEISEEEYNLWNTLKQEPMEKTKAQIAAEEFFPADRWNPDVTANRTGFEAGYNAATLKRRRIDPDNLSDEVVMALDKMKQFFINLCNADLKALSTAFGIGCGIAGLVKLYQIYQQIGHL